MKIGAGQFKMRKIALQCQEIFREFSKLFYLQNINLLFFQKAADISVFMSF